MSNFNPDHMLKYSFLWKISNFSAITFRDQSLIASPFIEPKAFDGTVWLVSILVQEPSDEEYLSVYLRRVSEDKGPPSIRVNFAFSLVNKNGEQRKFRCNTTSSFGRGMNKGFRNFILRKEILEEDSMFLLNDTLTLKGQMWKMSHWNAPIEKVLIRSKLEGELLFFNFRIHPWRESLTHTMHCNNVRGGFKLIFEWDMMELPSPPLLRFPRITIVPVLWVQKDTYITAHVWVKDQCDQLSFQTKESHCFKALTDSPWCLPRFDGPYDRYGYIDIDDLNFVCEFTITNGEQKDVFDSKYSSMHEGCLRNSCQPPRRNILTNVMKSVIGKTTFADVYLRVGKVAIPAHRVVLSAKSPVFRKLFVKVNSSWESALRSTASSLLLRGRTVSESSPDSDSCDKQTLDRAVEKCGLKVLRSGGSFIIVFSDIIESSVRKMLSFMYTDDIDDVDFNAAVQLLYESNRYLIDGLKEWCEHFLMSRISKENVWVLTHLAKRHKCEILLRATQLFSYEYSRS